MVYTYTPIYYSSLHDTITSLCKNILPFSFKKRGLIAAEQKLSKQQSENLKWQQESFHRILNLIGLHNEGMVPEKDVSAFRSHLLDTLIASPADQEQPTVIRDKLLFLQELLYTKCISEEEYHSSKRPLLQRLAVQGAEIDATDVIVGGQITENPEEEWSTIDFKDEETMMESNKKPKHHPMKRIKGAASLIHFSKNKTKNPLKPLDTNIYYSNNTNPFWGIPPTKTKENQAGSVVLMSESTPLQPPIKAEKETGSSTEKVKKKKSFRKLFHREANNTTLDHDGDDEKDAKAARKQWGFDGFKSWKRNESEDEQVTTPLPLGERSDDHKVSTKSCPIGEGPDTKLIKKKIHSDGSASDFFIDKVLGENIKKELSRIQTELGNKNTNLQFSNDQIDAISTRLPVDKADLKKFFPKSWCDRYGDIVLDVVKKEFKDHVGEMENMRSAMPTTRGDSDRWVSFDDNSENFTCRDQPQSHSFAPPRSILGEKLRTESTYSHDYNPFWSPKSSMMG